MPTSISIRCGLPAAVAVFLFQSVRADEPVPLPGTPPLAVTGDRSAQMVEGIDRFLMRALADSIASRATNWRRDFSSREAYERSVEPNREQLRRLIGAVDPRVPTRLETVAIIGTKTPDQRGGWTAQAVRWPVFDDVYGEGLLLRPTGEPRAEVIVLPDADQTPEQVAGLLPGVPEESQFARRLVEQGCLVLVPTLINRNDTNSGNPRIGRFTNQPHREWLYRPAFELGRHLIGYEVQKVQTAADALVALAVAQSSTPNSPLPLGLFGYGEGGLIALHAAALDLRFVATAVSGHFAARERIWEEPIYRNVFGLLREFGDAELASLILPRALLAEYSVSPTVAGPPASRGGRGGAAPGKIATPAFEQFLGEVRRANDLMRGFPGSPKVERFYNSEGTATPPGNPRTLLAFLNALGLKDESLRPTTNPPPCPTTAGELDERQRRQVAELENHIQRLLRESERVRDALTWNRLGASPADWEPRQRTNRAALWNDVIGRLSAANLPLNPRTRRIYDEPKWTGYEVMLDVLPDVFAWGYLLVPKDLKPGERRPVVVCQHGLEGVPEDTVATDPNHRGYGPYKGFATRLVERGFIVYAPHNPYRGGDKFRVLQRKANPLGLSLFSFIIAQHDATLTWLASLPFVDPQRMAFYGLSYGGKTAMRVPAVLERYCLSICSADFNDWIRKNATTDSGYSYLFSGEYEMPEWNLGHTFNYGEMAMLIAPRPFMVERGHDDGVAPDPWVAYEFAKIRRGYAKLGIGDRTTIEFFNGPHTINGVGTYKFLHQHLNWPEP